MKNQCSQWIRQHTQEIYELGDLLFKTPELGFKEEKTKKILVDYLQKHQISIHQEFARTGFSVSIGEGKPHIGLIAELDAIPTPGHPYADPVTSAAHTCGHSTQCTIMAAVISLLKELNITEYFPGKVTLFFTPAEEYTDMASRKEMKEKKEIRYFSGKQEMIADHILDDADVILHLHGSGEYHGHRFSVGSTLAGFIYKTFVFKGKAAHAAVMPDQGVNALNAYTLFQNAVGLLRETFRDEDMVRFHGVVTEGGSSVNSIPDRVVYESYIRSTSTEALNQLNEVLTNCAKHCAQALQADCEVYDTPGYFPLQQDDLLNKVIESNMLLFEDASEIRHHEKSIAAGDIGDVSLFKPTIQYGYTGFKGVMHGKDLMVEDKEEVYLRQIQIVAYSVIDLLKNPQLVSQIVRQYKPKMTYEEYMNHLNS